VERIRAIHEGEDMQRIHRYVPPILAPMLALSLATACGGDASPAADAGAPDAAPVTIGPEGGMLASPDGRLTMAVPPGALSRPTPLTITLSSAEPTGDTLGPIYEIGPSGTQFGQPVTIALRRDDLELGGLAPDDLAVVTAESAAPEPRRWEPLASPRIDATHVRGETTHLSDFALGRRHCALPGDISPDDEADLHDADAATPTQLCSGADTLRAGWDLRWPFSPGVCVEILYAYGPWGSPRSTHTSLSQEGKPNDFYALDLRVVDCDSRSPAVTPPVVAVLPGRVQQVVRDDHGELGRRVIVAHCAPATGASTGACADGEAAAYYSLYAHLDDVAADLETGDAVAAGDVLGSLGSSGTGAPDDEPHLHLALYSLAELGREFVCEEGDGWIYEGCNVDEPGDVDGPCVPGCSNWIVVDARSVLPEPMGGAVDLTSDQVYHVPPSGDACLIDDPACACARSGGEARGGSCYRLESQTWRTWDEAQAACAQTPGTHLVTIETADEQDWLTAFVGPDIWIGAHDNLDPDPADGNGDDNVYVWVNTTTRVPRNEDALDDRDFWSPGQPSHAFNENCAQMYGTTGLWNDLSCNWLLSYVCEQPLAPTR
jgi:hypothetical protein